MFYIPIILCGTVIVGGLVLIILLLLSTIFDLHIKWLDDLIEVIPVRDPDKWDVHYIGTIPILYAER